jgi:hypothetical protein
MSKSIHKGTELNNVKETWQENEYNRGGKGESGRQTDADEPAQNDLQQTIEEEAASYDNENKADRVLPGERASISDDDQ